MVGGLPPTTDGECRVGRRAERRVAPPWLTPQTAVPLVYCLFPFVGC